DRVEKQVQSGQAGQACRQNNVRDSITADIQLNQVAQPGRQAEARQLVATEVQSGQINRRLQSVQTLDRSVRRIQNFQAEQVGRGDLARRFAQRCADRGLQSSILYLNGLRFRRYRH